MCIRLIHLVAREHLLRTFACPLELVQEVLRVLFRQFLVFKFILLLIYVERLLRVDRLRLLAGVVQLVVRREKRAAQVVLVVEGVPALVRKGRLAD